MALNLTGLDLSIFFVYIAAVLALGLWATNRGQETKRDYFLAGDRLPWWMIGGSIMAANISSHHFVGIMGVAYNRGFAAFNLVWPSIIYCHASLLFVFLPFYLRNGFYTMPEFLNRRYGTAARAMFGALILLTYVFVEISAVLYMGAIAVHSLLGISMFWCIVGLAVLTSIYTITGGLRAVVWTEMFQLLVLVAGGLALTLMTIREVGGWSSVMEMSGDWHLLMPATDNDVPWTMFIGASLGIGIFYGAANQFIVQRALAAKNEWHARMGVVLAMYLTFLMPLIYILPGILARGLYPNLETGDLAFPTLVQKLLPSGMVGLVMAGLVAAVMSHISGSINSCVTIACMDFYLPYVRKNAGETECVRFGKIIGVVIVIISVCTTVLIARSDKPIFMYLLDVYGYFAPGITTMFLLGILWKRTTHVAALTAGVLTIPLSFCLQLCFGMPSLNRTGVVFWICIITAVVVSLCTQPEPAERLKGLIWNKESLRLPADQRANMPWILSPLLWAGIAIGLLVALYVWYR
jgi:solute:Na+ symporter, SSS family